MDTPSKTVPPAVWEYSLKTHTHTAEEWQRQYTTFEQLYSTEGHSLVDVKETMANQYGFHARSVHHFTGGMVQKVDTDFSGVNSEDQCRKKLAKWGLEKNTTRDTRAKRKERKMVDDEPAKGDKRVKGGALGGFQTRFQRPILAPPAGQTKAPQTIPPPAEQRNVHPACKYTSPTSIS